MPVIILGSSGSVPIDPTFDDGGAIQLMDTTIQNAGAFHILEQLITTSGTTVATNAPAGSSTFTDNTEDVHLQSIEQHGSFSIEVITTSSTTVTPNISPSTSPSPSPSDPGPTVGDFTDESIHISNTLVLFSGGFSVEVISVQDSSVETSSQTGSSSFTQGDVTSGTEQPPESDTSVLSGDGMSAPNITTSSTTVLS